MSNKEEIVNHKSSNQMQEGIKNAVNAGDSLLGDGLAMASNKIAPVAGPIVVKFIWKYKWLLLIAMVLGSCFVLFSLEAISLQLTANSRSLINQIPVEHRLCIEQADRKHGAEFELIASYGKVIADFNEEHTGEGKGFLEISEDLWESHGDDGNDNEEITHEDLCDNYFTLANKLGSLEGDAQSRINQYGYSNREEVLKWYELYKGVSMIPYGNPVGLDRSDLVTVTSGYNLVRIIFGVKHTHKGVDVVPSGTWFAENPGKGSTDAVNRAILYGRVRNIKDKNGALCSYVENDRYRTMYCHCDAFIAQEGAIVRYGDPVCFMGNTGFSTGVHTHIEIFEKAGDGSWFRVDPMPFLFPTQ